jgi:SAM-dependent methyltransferase
MLPGMDPDGFADSRYARMRWNTPLSEPHADQLLSLLDLRPGRDGLHLADLGCGWGELLLPAVGRAAGTGPAGAVTADLMTADRVTGTGVDTDPSALDRGRRRARDLGLNRQVEFVREDAAAWTGKAGRVLCVGSAHAFGGAGPALRALLPVIPAGGGLLFGDGGWPATPSAAALAIFGEQVLPLSELLSECRGVLDFAYLVLTH